MHNEVDRILGEDHYIQTVNENIMKLGLNLPLPAFLVNKRKSTGRQCVIKPETKIGSKVNDLAYPTDVQVKRIATEGLKNAFHEEKPTISTLADLPFSLKDDHLSNKTLESKAKNDSEVGELYTLEASDELSSRMTNMGQDGHEDAKEEMLSSAEGYVSVDANYKDVIESLSKSASINNDQEDVDDYSTSTTSDSCSDFPQGAEVFSDPNSECSSDISSVVSCCELAFSDASLNFAGQSNTINASEDLQMETINLSDKIKLDQSRVMVKNDVNLYISSMSGCLHSYKKKFQTSFSSRKRLEKDYKLLPIWHGDIDADFSQLTWSNRTIGPTVQDDLKKSKGQDVEDTEWEII